MRSLLLLSVVVLAFLALRWFRSPQAAASADPTFATEAGVRFLPPPAQEQRGNSGPEAVGNRGEAPTVPETVPEEGGLVAAPEVDSHRPRTATAPDEIQVAAALAHGTPPEVQAVSGGLSKDRALLLEAFAWAVAGERQVALSLSEKIDRDSVPGRERALLECALTGRAPSPATLDAGPVALAMDIALSAREAREELEAKRFPEAAQSYSRLLTSELDAPWPADAGVLATWTEGLDRAQREHRWSQRGAWQGEEMVVQSGESLIHIRKRYLAQHPGAVLCTGLIERSNRVKGFLQPGQKLRVPSDPVRVVVDLEARWALFFFGEEVAASWPVGIGRPGEETPPGDYVAVDKTENPAWMKVGQDPIPFGDPKNPLGTRWIGWSKGGQKTSYGFHGTSEPESVGHAASDGCVRLLNQDVEELFQILPEGAPIQIRQ